MQDVNYWFVFVSALIAICSPGPATLAIAGSSMGQGRISGVALASGVLTGSVFWSVTAASGFAAILYAYTWLFEALRYLGASYLLFLAYKSLRSALSPKEVLISTSGKTTFKSQYLRGLLIHLTNPKAIFFFGALYSVGLPASATTLELVSVIGLVAAVSTCVFIGYAILFSYPRARTLYTKMRRSIEATFAVIFGVAGFRVLFGKLGS